MNNIKEEAQVLIKSMPDGVTWDDIMYQIYVKQKILKGIQASDEGRTKTQDEVKKMFLNK